MPALSNVGPFEVHVSREGDTVTLDLDGELDLASIDFVREQLAEAMRDGSSRVVMDLRNLTFIDSTGISLLLRAVKDNGARLSFIPSRSSSVQRIFSVTGVAAVFGGSRQDSHDGDV